MLIIDGGSVNSGEYSKSNVRTDEGEVGWPSSRPSDGGSVNLAATGVGEGLPQNEYANEAKHRDAAVSLAVAEVAQVIFG